MADIVFDHGPSSLLSQPIPARQRTLTTWNFFAIPCTGAPYLSVPKMDLQLRVQPLSKKKLSYLFGYLQETFKNNLGNNNVSCMNSQ